jgi:D-aminopeptidase
MERTSIRPAAAPDDGTAALPDARPAGPPAARTRPRDLGIAIGPLPTGPTNSIVDVAHVSVGHATVWRDEPVPPRGRGVARTGVTAIVPFDGYGLFRDRVAAGAAVLNGAGAALGRTAIEEWGVIETPIFLTSSMAIGRVYDAAVTLLHRSEAVASRREPIMPVVAECDDGFLDQGFPVQVEAADVVSAFDSAAGPEAGPVAGGAVGAGTGMRAFGLKGGIGSASRIVAPRHRWAPGGSEGESAAGERYTVGALVLANYGELPRLTIDGVRVGEVLAAEGWPAAGIPGDDTAASEARAAARSTAARGADGSCIVVVATDAPLLPNQLRRMAVRAGLGLARTGSIAHHGSGEIFLAFSTGTRIPRGGSEPVLTFRAVDDEFLDSLFGAVVDATEEAAIDALFTADTVRGRDGHVVPGLPVERTLELLEAAGRLSAARRQPATTAARPAASRAPSATGA